MMMDGINNYDEHDDIQPDIRLKLDNYLLLNDGDGEEKSISEYINSPF